MECLGINPHDGAVYEGRMNCGFRTQPPPLLLPIEFVGLPSESKWKDPVEGYAHTIFREDSFDSVTRIRRGRVFVLYDGVQKRQWTVHDPARDDLPGVVIGTGTAKETSVLFYGRAPLSTLRDSEKWCVRPVVALGSESFLTLWTVLTVESSVHGTPILTLKAQRSFGTLPDLDPSRVPDEIRTALTQALEKVEDSAHRLGAEAVIDRCRDALSVVFGHACGDRGTDLMRAIDKSRTDQREEVRHWAGRIVARLHSRVKPNEQEKRGTPRVTEDDAQLALSCLGVALRDLGYAKAD